MVHLGLAYLLHSTYSLVLSEKHFSLCRLSGQASQRTASASSTRAAWEEDSKGKASKPLPRSRIGSGQRKTPLNSFPASSPDFLPSACLYVSPQSLKEGRTCFQSGVEIMCLTRGKSAPFFSSFISVTWAGRTWPHTNLNTSHPHGGSSHPKAQCLSWSSLPLLCHHENKTQILLFGRLESLMVILKHAVLINTPKQLKALESLFKTTKAFPDEMPPVYWSLTRDMSFPGMHTSFLHEHRPLISSEKHMSPGVKEEGSPE